MSCERPVFSICWKIVTGFFLFKQAENSANVTRKDGYCMWYGQCGTNPATKKPVNCVYNGPAKPVDGKKSFDILAELCPEFSHNGSKVCCSFDQIASLQSGLKSAQQMMARCPSCWKNFCELYCSMTCSPNNSMFMSVEKVAPNNNKSILAINYYVDKTFRDGLYNSCKNVIFPSSNQKIMNFMCGTSADKCNPLKFLRFMGNPSLNGVSPFLINYPTTPAEGIVPMYADIHLCNESVFQPFTNSTLSPCSCQDCIQSCPVLPHYIPPEHWHLDIGDIHFNLISFVTLLVYLAFLVLFTAGSILYFNYSSSRYNFQTNEHPKAIIGGRQGLLERLGKRFDETIKNIFTKWGYICSEFSIFVIIGAVGFVIICSVGVTKFTVVTDPVKLWSAPGSQARLEKDIFDKQFQPFYRTAQVIFSLKSDSKKNSETCYHNFNTKPGDCILTGSILRLEILHKVSGRN